VNVPGFSGDVVVLVHGLWMNGLEFASLEHRLRYDHGFETRTFSYPSLHGETTRIGRDLAEFAWRVAGERRVHFVGHSLGGAFVYRALTERGAGRNVGNSVLLGTPLDGSAAARGVGRWPMLRPVLGPHVPVELAEPRGRRWSGGSALGVIAGNLRMGTGQFFARFDGEHDGTVAVDETRIPGLTDHIVLPHSHMGLLFAADVARQVAHFLRHGRFAR
jgi:pimeloyl-ACP methyl ester carboxylesterase